jgi:D-cysteine desulfhydrase
MAAREPPLKRQKKEDAGGEEEEEEERTSSSTLAADAASELLSSIPLPPRERLFRENVSVEPLPPRFWDMLGQLASPEGISLPHPRSVLDAVKIDIARHDVNDCLLTGNKARKMEFVMAHARQSVPGVKRLWTIGGLQSNHARTVAVVAARLGLEFHWVCRTPTGEAPDLRSRETSFPYSNLGGNYFLTEHMLGAHMHWCTPDEYRDGPSLIHRLREAHDTEVGDDLAYEIPEGASFPPGMWGYVYAFLELCSHFLQRRGEDKPVTHLVTAVGSGGTLAGLVLGQYLVAKVKPELSWQHLRIVGIPVCDDAAYFRARICGQIRDTVAQYGAEFGLEPAEFASLEAESEAWFDLWDGFVGGGYGQASPDQMSVMRAAASCGGFVFDPTYSGKAFLAVIKSIAASPAAWAGKNIVFLHTGGIFGLLAQWEIFNEAASSQASGGDAPEGDGTTA